MGKKVIVDGVYVGKCKQYTAEYDLDFNKCGHICKGTECKYKRLWYKRKLARKTAECNLLKEEIDYLNTLLAGVDI